MAAVLYFLEETAGDHKKRLISDIWDWPDDAWEGEHDFIQWLFPLAEKSMSVPNAPVIREPEITWIIESQIAQDSLTKSTARYQAFLANNTHWMTDSNHNHLRITRVIKSLRLLCGNTKADDFKHFVAGQLGDQIDQINEKTRQYWRLA